MKEINIIWQEPGKEGYIMTEITIIILAIIAYMNNKNVRTLLTRIERMEKEKSSLHPQWDSREDK